MVSGLSEFLFTASERDGSVYLIKAYSLEDAERKMYTQILASDPATRRYAGTIRDSRVIHGCLGERNVRNVRFTTIE
jgi:hypothetical protein